MSRVKIKSIPIFSPIKSSTSGYSSSGGNKSSNKRNYSGQTFQDIFKQMMEKQSRKSNNNLVREFNFSIWLCFMLSLSMPYL